MPLTETTVVKDTTGNVLEESERKLYTLAELKALDDRPAPEQDDKIESGAVDRALDWLRQGQGEFWSGLDELDAYIQPELFGLAGITFNAKSATYVVGDYSHGSAWFALPRDTDIDVPLFLRAMKDFYAGRDYRGKEYAKAEGERVVAVGRSQKKIDLRSKDVRIVKEQGLVVHVISSPYERTTDSFDTEERYGYEDVSGEFKTDCNFFLSELCHEAAKILEADYESQFEEETLLDVAEANEYTFDRTGRRA